VAGAAVFTTFEHTQELRNLVAWSEGQPAPTLTKPWTASTEYESYQLFEAAMEMPVIQYGERPYAAIGEGLILRDANGEPTVVDTQEIRLILSIPKAEPPQEGFPLTLYLHGSGGEAYQFADRGPLVEDAPRDQQPEPPPGTGPAEWLARRGVAALGFDFPLHGARDTPPDTSGLKLYNLFGNLSATIDNFNVSAMEVTRISRLMVDTEVPLASLTGVAAGLPSGTVRFDPERLTAFGQSMGTTIGVNWAGVDPRVKGLLFSGAGGMLIEIAVTAIEPVELKGVAELALHLDEDEAEVHIQHPILHAAQNIWDLVDPVAKARHVVAEPYPDRAPRHVMMTAGFRDGYFHPRSEAAIAAAMGLPQVGEEVEPTVPAVLALAGVDKVSYPVQGNLSGRTAAVIQYAAPFNLGHYVVFNQEGARHQYTCFLASVGADGARLDAPGGLDDPCP
jgi:pimeloyl-ACP methyl ester carboxylesterase